MHICVCKTESISFLDLQHRYLPRAIICRSPLGEHSPVLCCSSCKVWLPSKPSEAIYAANLHVLIIISFFFSRWKRTMGSASTSCGFHIKKRKEMGDKELELGSAPSLWCRLGLLWPKCKHLVLFNLMASIKLEHFLPEVSKHFVGIIYEHRKKKKKKKKKKGEEKEENQEALCTRNRLLSKVSNRWISKVQRWFFLLKKVNATCISRSSKTEQKRFLHLSVWLKFGVQYRKLNNLFSSAR